MNKTYQVSKKGIEGLLAGTVLAIVVFALIWPPVGVIFAALVVGAIIV
ncbi:MULTISPECIES: hypothetical protein [unclassified Mucilaginibacter]|nr:MULTISPECIES: hypothetical protein [unclassified Mucilaginibacter]MEB0262837.1 hypothetical protein [Mucilaginibacter sp. 10I4]MEB0277676.1 hypothetical protein [Mucilaginibacter sp. 10B2]MEB0301935.1 hypothetical protein [Mucilaginibacter sp. 5C4]WPX24697.1 hypothetical protein RHM67_05350 [Mucilaginibacter sp. 5C4]